MHLVGFITKKFVTMHGQMNVKLHFLFIPLTTCDIHMAVMLRSLCGNCIPESISPLNQIFHKNICHNLVMIRHLNSRGLCANL